MIISIIYNAGQIFDYSYLHLNYVHDTFLKKAKQPKY